MEDRSNNIMLSKPHAMNGGDGPNSYSQNSVYQRRITEAAKVIINEEITKKLDIQKFSSAILGTFRIADLDCLCGPNTILEIQNIVEAVECKFQTPGLISPEFQVFFNDQVPKGLLDKTGPARNKGRIHYIGAPKEVFEAYSDQFAMDIDSFPKARVKELAPGGLMTLLLPAAPDVASYPQVAVGSEVELVGSCLMDLAKMELQQIIEGNGCFSIKRMDILNCPKHHQALPELTQRVLFARAILEKVIEKHFGTEIVDHLFQMYTTKFSESPVFLNPEYYQTIELFVLLKRNEN
ncbi:hypothetical protein PTKIN_Ptkin16aG0014400 [Pterospermum kingtungense]